MANRSRLLAFGAFALASVIAISTAPRTSVAAPPKPPPGFPPIAGCGKISATIYQDLNGNTIVCKVWRKDGVGTPYRFNGIDAYNVNDLVFVQGQVCTICSSFCGGAVPILNSVTTSCQ